MPPAPSPMAMPPADWAFAAPQMVNPAIVIAAAALNNCLRTAHMTGSSQKLRRSPETVSFGAHQVFISLSSPEKPCSKKQGVRCRRSGHVYLWRVQD